MKSEEDFTYSTVQDFGSISVSTQGANSAGIAGFVYDGNIGVTSTGDIRTQGDNSEGIFAYVYDTGNINVTSTGDITTQGNGAQGIYAYTYNGNVSVNSNGKINAFDDGIFGGVLGNGNVTINSTGNLSSAQEEGIDAEVQGNGNISITSNGTINSADEGIDATIRGATGGDISISSTGNITSRDGAGIDAQISNNGNMQISSTGNIGATGNNASGINSQVSAGSTATVNLLGGTLRGGSGSGAGVNFSGPAGASNILNTSGAVTLSALSGTALNGGAGNTTVNNLGTLTTVGTADLGTGTNALNNRAGATFNAGMRVELGAAGNRLTNAGTLSPGGSSAVAITDIGGSFVQTASGEFLVDLDQGARTADRLNVTGTANLAGNVRAQVTNLTPGAQRQTILSAAGGTTNNGLGLIATSPALNASLLFPNATDLVLATALDFTAPATGLNRNQRRLASNLNAAIGAGSGGLEPLLLALVNGPVTAQQYLDALNRLVPEVYLNTETATLFSSRAFSDDLFSCPIEGRGEAFIQEGQCLWVRPRGYDLDFDGTFENASFDERTRGLSAGVQYHFAPGWYANLGLGYERSSTETDTGADSDSDRYQAGLAIKYQTGPWLFAGALSGGIAQFETKRPVAFAGFPAARASSEHDVWFIAGQLRGAYLLDLGAWYAKPILDLNLTYIDRDALSESGAGAANLRVDGRSETIFSASPAIELGTQFEVAPDAHIKPFIKAGITYLADNDYGLTASFLSAPAGIGGFTVTSEIDDLFTDIEAGLAIIKTNNTSLSLGYQGRIGEDTDQHGLYAKVAWRF